MSQRKTTLAEYIPEKSADSTYAGSWVCDGDLLLLRETISQPTIKCYFLHFNSATNAIKRVMSAAASSLSLFLTVIYWEEADDRTPNTHCMYQTPAP